MTIPVGDYTFYLALDDLLYRHPYPTWIDAGTVK